MADFAHLQTSLQSAINLLGQLPALRQQVSDLQAKLAAAPHDDPTVQQTVDQLSTTLDAALASAQPAPAPTPSPAPVDPNAPQGTAAAPTPGQPT